MQDKTCMCWSPVLLVSLTANNGRPMNDYWHSLVGHQIQRPPIKTNRGIAAPLEKKIIHIFIKATYFFSKNEGYCNETRNKPLSSFDHIKCTYFHQICRKTVLSHKRSNTCYWLLLSWWRKYLHVMGQSHIYLYFLFYGNNQVFLFCNCIYFVELILLQE